MRKKLRNILIGMAVAIIAALAANHIVFGVQSTAQPELLEPARSYAYCDHGKVCG